MAHPHLTLRTTRNRLFSCYATGSQNPLFLNMGSVKRYEVFDDSIWFTFANGLGRNIEDFGKYVFLTQEEAEKKLKEMEVNKDLER